MTISIHAPSRERPVCLSALIGSFGIFQSTLPRGSDTSTNNNIDIVYPISIHAPSRERLFRGMKDDRQREFQSTLPRGSDRTIFLLASCVTYFNPRSLAGATMAKELIVDMLWDFNPRSLAGATMTGSGSASESATFQSTLPRGSDGAVQTAPIALIISIHAPSRERQTANFQLSQQAQFQSTLPRGSDCTEEKLGTVQGYFNPRSLAGATA